MKKYFLASFAAFIVLGLGSFLYSADNTSLQMELTKKEGEVKTKRSTEDPWQNAEPKMILTKGAALKTGLDSYAELALNADNRFRVKGESEVELAKLMDPSTAADGSVVKLVNFNLKSGTMLAKLEHLPRGTKLSVESPTAVAGASGTEFSVAVEERGQTHVAVLQNKVVVTSVGDSNKTTTAGKFQQVDVAPWDAALIQAKGTGLLSEKILGKKFVEQAKQDIQLAGVGANHLAALRSLTDRVMDISLSADQKIGDFLNGNVEASERVFRVISQAKIVRTTQLPNGANEEEVQVSLVQISEALGRPVTSVTQTIRPVSLEEYGAKFGPLARVTTRRAAQVDALRKLAERIYGAVVTSDTTVKDLEATNDKITTTVKGIVQGGEIIREFYYSDGSVSVEVQARGAQVKNGLTSAAGDIFGKNYMSAPARIMIADFETYRELEKI